MNDLDLLEVV